ncbi:MAG: hypothetical protein HY934_04215 [Candidatus Firestonebacteria bacterium]|nr:hypothetical protein [Candidatus Firestonebacteria bacterium]
MRQNALKHQYLYIKISLIFILICNFFPTKTIAAEITKETKEEFKGEIGEWKTTESLLEPVSKHYSFSVLDKIYIFTGQNLATSRAIVLSSEIDENGIKSWKKAPPLAYVLEEFGAYYKDGYLYIAGGKNMGFERGSVISFPINPDGTLGRANSAFFLPEPLIKTAVTVNKGYIFVCGGKIGNKLSNKVFSSPIDNNGIPGKWQELAPLPVSVYDHIMFSYNDFIYVSGGYHNGESVYGAKVSSPGTIEKWISMDDMPLSLEKHAGIVYKDYIFISGGIKDGIPQSKVFAGKFLEGGLIIFWKELKSLPQPVFSHSITINKNFMIVSGGISGGRPQTKILISPIH